MTKNGNGKAFKITMGVLIAIGTLVGGIIWYAGRKTQTIELNTKGIAELEPRVTSTEKACQEYKYNIDRLDEKLTEQSSTQNQILAVQRQILDEVKK